MKVDGLPPLLIAAFVLFLACVPVNAATERIVDYEYDAAGNIVRIISREQSDPPVVGPLTPVFINQGRIRLISATGSNLLGIDVSTDYPGLSIEAVTSDETQITFQLTATSQAPVGEAIIRFTTGLGEAQQSIFVAEASPGLTATPTPIAVDLSGAPKSVVLTFSEPRPEDETYSLAIRDPGTAALSADSFTISSGETEVTISISGLSNGATNLQIDLAQKFYTYNFPVYANESYAELLTLFPDMQNRNLFANPVGVVIQDNNPYLPNTAIAAPVGVLVDSNAAYYAKPVGVFYGDDLAGQLLSKPVGVFYINDLAGQLLSKPVGVLYGDDLGGQLLSKPVGVLVSSSVSFAYSTPVGAIYGPIADTSQPPTVAVGTAVDFSITGFNLSEVQTVKVSPSDDITVGVISINPEGTLLSIPLTIDPLAATGQRELVLEDDIGPIVSRSGLPLTFDIQ